ncbi:MAG: hypothetical protein M2R45_02801 [Verrucomicrobia subdivision 3 bacterium]|nr:hypothetical protein [Limisphaerales bacterium]MCS1414353.1 hypothetical protein [Limisphaerales bacterium]
MPTGDFKIEKFDVARFVTPRLTAAAFNIDHGEMLVVE